MSQASIVAFFCEDIREEKNAAETFVGVMPDNVVVPAIPGAFPKLALYLRAHIDVELEKSVTDLKLTVKLADETILELGALSREQILKEMETARRSGGTYAGMLMRAVAGNFPIPVAGRVQVIASFAGNQYICGRMNVHTAETAAPGEPRET